MGLCFSDDFLKINGTKYYVEDDEIRKGNQGEILLVENEKFEKFAIKKIVQE